MIWKFSMKIMTFQDVLKFLGEIILSTLSRYKIQIQRNMERKRISNFENYIYKLQFIKNCSHSQRKLLTYRRRSYVQCGKHTILLGL